MITELSPLVLGGLVSGSPGALLRRGPLRTVRARRPSTRLRQALKARGGQKRWVQAVVGRQPTCAVGVDETEREGFVRRAWPGVGGDRLEADRLAGRREPLLPLLGALRLVVGVQQQAAAQRTATVLRIQQAQSGLVQPGQGRQGTPCRPRSGGGRSLSRRTSGGSGRCRGRQTPSGPAWRG